MGITFLEDVETFNEFEKRTDTRTLAQKALDIPMSAISGVATGGGALLSLPEELPNLALQGGTWAGKKLGLVDKDFQMPRINIHPALPSFEAMEDFRTEGKIGDYTIPKWKETAGKVLDYKPVTQAGEFVQTGAEWAAPAGIFGKTPMAISGGSGLFSEYLEQSGMNSLVTEQDDKEGGTNKSVKYSILYMKAVKALQEAMARIETLESEVNTLKGG